MRLHYQRANPDTGGESFLLRFEGVCQERIACLLVNSGRGVQVDRLLDESRGEYLMGIVINNAHPEYYCTLEENAREDTPIYATPETAQIMATAIGRSTDQPSVLDQLVGVDGWYQLIGGVEIHPLPVGHAPGTAGFLFEIIDGERYHTLLVADEYTASHAGGYAGVVLDLDVEIDAMILTDAVDQPVAPALTRACSTICERAAAGSTVLVTTDEPTGLHVASLLGRLSARFDTPRSIATTGRIAALWKQFGYSMPNVTANPEGTPAVLDPGTVTVATPTTPVEGLSGRLFEELADDPDGAVVRLSHGEATPMPAAQCTVQSLPWHNAPTRDTRDTVIDAFDPVQVVLADRNTRATERISPDCDSFVWRVDDDLVYTLFDGSGWVAPAEIDPDIEHRIRSRVPDRSDRPLLSEHDLAIPPRRSDCDVAAEGIDGETIYDRLPTTDGPHERSTPTTALPTNGTETEPSATDGGTASIEGALTSLREQLAVAESIMDERTHRARVVDAGDDVCLFRVQNPPASFEHGQEITLLLDPIGEKTARPHNRQVATENGDSADVDTDSRAETTDSTNEAV